MLTPSDGSSDGNKLEYLSNPEKHRHFDPTLFDTLLQEAAEPDQRRLQAIEHSGVVQGTLYFNEPLLDNIIDRKDFMERCAETLGDADLVFFDPDNGIEVPSRPRGRKNSSKYIYLDELADFYSQNQSLLIYQHFPHIERSFFIASKVEQLREIAFGCSIWTYTTAHVLFLLVIHPESPARLAFAAIAACQRWDSTFIKGQYLGRD